MADETRRDDRVSIKVREVDYQAVVAVTEQFPLSLMDAVTAMRLLWQSSSDKARLDAIRKVTSVEKIPA